MRTIVAAAVLAGSVGCTALGDGDVEKARELVFSNAGTPMFAGQALMHTSCGDGSFCHSSGIPRLEDRNGAPHGLNYDLFPSCDDLNPTRSRAAEIRRGQRDIYEHRDTAWALVDGEAMPPRSAEFDALFLRNPRDEEGAFEWERTNTPACTPDPCPDDPSTTAVEICADSECPGGGSCDPAFFCHVPLPMLDTEEGREILRNWLAAGSPVIEATVSPAPGMDPAADCEDGTTGDCIIAAQPCVPSPSWDSIYRIVISPQCGQACHAGPPNEFLAQHHLDLSTADLAYTNLVGALAMGEDMPDSDACGDTGRTRVVPGDSGASLLLDKMAGDRDYDEDGAPDLDCGTPMPQSASDLMPFAVLDVIAAWIDHDCATADDCTAGEDCVDGLCR